MPILRDVVESDLPVFFEHQRDPEAIAMADFPARDREAFDAHWKRILANPGLTKKTIVFEGQVAGNAVSWPQDGGSSSATGSARSSGAKASRRRRSPS